LPLPALALLVLVAVDCAGGRGLPAASLLPLGPAASDAPAAPLPTAVAPIVPAAAQITLIRSPSCSCCGGHEQHLLHAGYRVSSQFTDDYLSVKDAHLIPADMRSCHTSLVGRYFVEGHVPAAAIEQLVREQPAIDGIALPGMPAGAPGMGGTAEGLLVVYSISDGKVVGEFGRFEAPLEP
jgi:hypothetical protein